MNGAPDPSTRRLRKSFASFPTALFVDPAERRRGYGSALLTELETAARELGRPTLVIFVIEGSREIGTGPNRAFAARHGYRVAEEHIRRDLGWPRPDGELDRPALRHLIFQSPEKRRDLEAILHPLIREHMEQQASGAGEPYLVLSIPLLVEGGDARDRVDRILVVDADESHQLQRRSERLKAADDVILNSGSVPELRQAVDRLHHRYLELASR